MATARYRRSKTLPKRLPGIVDMLAAVGRAGIQVDGVNWYVIS